MPPVERLRFDVRGAGAARGNDPLVDYLASANLRIARLDDTEHLRVRLTRFPELTFASAQLPPAVIEWPRDLLSLERAAVVICMSGRMVVDTEGAVLRREPGLHLLPPDSTPVRFETFDVVNEVLYISMPASLVSELDVATSSTSRPSIPSSITAPLLAFAASLSSSPVGESPVIGPLRSAAVEVARAFARLIAEGDAAELTLFARVMRLIVEHYTDARLSVPKLAEMAGVSERGVQAAFAAEGTTAVREIRETRARAARDLRARNPQATATWVAAAAGFGSVSSLQRALGRTTE